MEKIEYTEEQKAINEEEQQKMLFQKVMQSYSVAINKMAKDYGMEGDKIKSYHEDAERVRMYLSDPQKWRNQLIDLSMDLFVTVPQYQNLIKYFGDMACLTPYIIPIKPLKTTESIFKREYEECCYLLEKMNIETEYRKAITNVIREGVFFGYEIETEDSYTIKHLNPKYCRVIGSLDGCWIYEFDFSFFDNKRKKGTNELLLKSYPIEFQEKYLAYRKDKKNLRWQVVSEDKQVCLRYFPELNSPCMDFPPYCDLFEDILNLIDFKALNKVKAEMENYKFLALVMETNDKDGGMNKFKVDPALVSQYFDFLVDACGEAITPFISPVPVQEIQYTNPNKDIDQVSDAEDSFWKSAGVNSTLFGTGIKSGTGLNSSIKVDENKMSGLYNQIETLLTKKMKRTFKNFFKVKLPHVTKFNQDEMIDRLLKNAQFGIGSKMEMLAILGYTPAEVEGMLLLENDILKLIDKMKPLQSSHTQSGEQQSTEVESTSRQQLRTKGRPNVNNDSNEDEDKAEKEGNGSDE